ncbi:MAG: type VII secretion target [Mycobacterium sp.]|uniref:type VII secretion target n=1 Tax=Mycobacterium sp. TaxID=1785 RepID=UPI0026306CE6|nr:type VII secretion target [Mycobacterium sp.]MDI3314705.1 type VII secretion target [Mycobacterium sp.]
MGYRDTASIDVAAVRALAGRFQATAEILDEVARNHLACLTFGGAAAGRAHSARGDALRTALMRWAAEVSQWSLATGEIARALRASADRYADAELRAASGIG